MQKKFNNIYVSLAALCSLCLLAASCLSDDYDTETASAGAPSIRLYITANGMGDLNATRTDYTRGETRYTPSTETGETEAGEDGEFINSLCVFVVNSSNEIEYKFLATTSSPSGFGSDASAAGSGNLLAHSINLINSSTGGFISSITTGKKTIYAFANWETLDTTKDDIDGTTEGNRTLVNDIIDPDNGLDVGDELSSEDLQLWIYDPASKINLDTEKGTLYYIPMSGMTTATISEDLNYSSQLISVGLDRLVGKVRLSVLPETTPDDTDQSKENAKGTITETRADAYTCVEISKLKFSNGADKVALFSDNTPSGTINYTKVYKGSDMKKLNENLWSSNTCTIDNETTPVAKDIAEFYINETVLPSGSTPNGFDVALFTTRDGEGGYNYYSTGVSQETSVLRNEIYPLLLTLDVVTVDFDESKIRTAGIGTTETKYLNYEETPNGTYVFELLDVTTSVILTPVLKINNSTTDVNNVTWKLEINLDENGNAVTDGNEDGLVIQTEDSNGYLYTEDRSLTIGHGESSPYDDYTSFYITHFTGIEYDKYNYAKLSATWYTPSTDKYKHTRSFMLRFTIDLDEGIAPELSNLPIAPWTLTKKNIAPLRPLTRRLD